MTPEMREAGAELARRSRAAQGLPMKVTDPVVLKKVAAIFAYRHKENAA